MAQALGKRTTYMRKKHIESAKLVIGSIIREFSDDPAAALNESGTYVSEVVVDLVYEASKDHGLLPDESRRLSNKAREKANGLWWEWRETVEQGVFDHFKERAS